jgi:hypothetical protein
MPLLPCPDCARHVRTGEGACPFCRGRLPASFASLRVRRLPPRSGRAGAYAHTASASLLAIAAAACGGLTNGGDGGAGQEEASADGTAMDQLVSTHYGGAPPDATVDAGSSDALGLLDVIADSVDAKLRDGGSDACPGDQVWCAAADACCYQAPPYGAPVPPDPREGGAVRSWGLPRAAGGG